MSKIRICIVPEYPNSLMTGGMQVQAEKTCAALRRQGANAELFDWTRKQLPADLYHFIGFPAYLAELARLVRAAGKRYVCTVLTGGLSDQTRMLKAQVKLAIARCYSASRLHEEMLCEADAVIAIIKADAEGLQKLYHPASGPIRVVANGVDDAFFSATPDLWRQRLGTTPFLLSVGAIQRRKNQWLLADLCNQIGIALVLLGSVLPGECAYARAVERAMDLNSRRYGGRWIKDLGPDDPLLISAFSACNAFALFSAAETQPLSILQAMAAQRPVLLGKAEYTLEPPFNSLPTVSLNKPQQVLDTMSNFWKKGELTTLPVSYRWDQVAAELITIYEEIPGLKTIHKEALV